MKRTNKNILIILVLYIFCKIFLSENIMFIANEIMSPIFALMAFWILVKAYNNSSKYRTYILCMIIATTTYLVGDITWIHYEFFISVDVPVKHISSFFYMISSVFVVISVMALIARLYKNWSKFRTTLDVFVMGTLIAYIALNGFFSAKFSILSPGVNNKDLIIMSEIFMDFLLLMGIFIIYHSDRSYLKNKYGRLKFIGILIWSVADLTKWYMEIFKGYFTGNTVELLWPISLLIIAVGIYGMKREFFEKTIFEESIEDRDSVKSITIPIFLLFIATLIFKPSLEYIVFFVLLIFFRVLLYRYIGIHEENYKISLKYKAVNEALNVKINDINTFNSNLEKNFDERTRELEIKNKELYITANIDPLTKIPNRRNFMDRLDNVIMNGGDDNYFAILFIDLDRFKAINDWYGHDKGDIVLIDTARRIRESIKANDFLARLGGDEFVVILEKINNIDDVMNRANFIIEEFRKFFLIEGKNIVSTISIGISIYPVNSRQRSELMKFADVALYRAKTGGKNRAVIYDKNMKKEESRKLEIESRLNEGFSNGELYLKYQPQILVNSEKIVGVEALIRWKDSALGEIGPSEFIGIAEENGLIFEIGEFVIKESFKVIKYLNEKYKTNITMAINVSAKQFNAINLVNNIRDMASWYDVDLRWIEIEITENLSIRNEEMVLAKLEELKHTGITVSVDDFGIGYSSFSYLKKYPIDKLKIDRAFIIGVADNREDYRIVKSIISMCKELGISVIAEGVEKRVQVNILKQLGCDIIQGYYYSKPIGLEDLENVYFERKGEPNSSHPHGEEIYDIFELT